MNSKQPQGPADHFPADLKAAQTEQNGVRQIELERTLNSTSTSPPPPTGALIDFQRDLKGALPTLKRTTTDGSVDEFVDAEG